MISADLTKMEEDEPLSMCSVEIDGNGDYFIRGRNKDKCKELLNDISFKEEKWAEIKQNLLQ